jgi:hypothetical protein
MAELHQVTPREDRHMTDIPEGFAGLGFEQDESGAYVWRGCRVSFHQVGSDYDVAITLPGGEGVFFVVPVSAVTTQTREQAEVEGAKPIPY